MSRALCNRFNNRHTHTHTWQQQQTFSNTNTVKALTVFIIYNFQRRTVITTNARHLRDMAPRVLQMIHSWEVLFLGPPLLIKGFLRLFDCPHEYQGNTLS